MEQRNVKYDSNGLGRVAELVLYGKVLTRSEGSKFYWQTVEVLNVITNRTPFPVPTAIRVAHTIEEQDLARTNAVLYLMHYSSSNYWRAIGLPQMPAPF